MDELQNLLALRIKELDSITEQARDFLAKAPEGSLRIARRQNSVQYYHRLDKKDARGKYIRKREAELVRRLAQKDYAQKFLISVCKEKDALTKFHQQYQTNTLQKVYEQLPSYRKVLVSPYVMSDEDYALQWRGETYPISYQPQNDGIYTENGETVRSKSEKILADKFKMMNIPYYYEKPLYLRGYGTIHPDFTLLNKRTRREYYWEHMGMMDNSEYAAKAIKKIETMNQNAIFQGRNLIITYETSAHPLNMRVVERLIQEYLL